VGTGWEQGGNRARGLLTPFQLPSPSFSLILHVLAFFRGICYDSGDTVWVPEKMNRS